MVDVKLLDSFMYNEKLTEYSEFIHLVYKETSQFLEKYGNHGVRVNVDRLDVDMEVVDNTKGAVAKSKRNSRPDAPIYMPPAVRRQGPSSSKDMPCAENCNNHGQERKLKNDKNNVTVCNKNKIILDSYVETDIEKEKDIVPENVIEKKCTKLDVPWQKFCQLSINNSSIIKTDLDKKVITPITDKVKDSDQEQQELVHASKEINKKKRIIKQSFDVSNELIINNDNVYDIPKKKEPLVDNWEDLLDKELGSELVFEIIESVGETSIELAKENYTQYEEKRTLEGDFSHVLEVYDFPEDFQTRDIVSILKPLKFDAFHIKWVDDSHALAVFSSGFVAQRVFSTFSHPLIKLRPLDKASKQSIIKAIKCPDAMMPPAVRPQTCPQTARRMVTASLGLKMSNSREERAQEIKILKEAREKKKLSAKQEEDAWLGNPNSSMD